jgi:hypothetical protein
MSRRCHKKPWTAAEIAYLRAHYKQDRTAAEIATRLGRGRSSIFGQADRLGLLARGRRWHAGRGEPWEKTVRRLHAKGWTDGPIARLFHRDRRGICEWRIKLGLPANGRSLWYRRRVGRKTRAQCRQAGVANLSQLRLKVWREAVSRMGWPEDLRPRGAQILDLLYREGPLARREIAERCGMPWKGTRKSLLSNDPEGSYLAHLIRRGLVITPGRRRNGRPGWETLYAVPLGVAPRPPADRRGEGEKRRRGA